jgi:hypothetical protein
MYYTYFFLRMKTELVKEKDIKQWSINRLEIDPPDRNLSNMIDPLMKIAIEMTKSISSKNPFLLKLNVSYSMVNSPEARSS